MLPLKFFSKEPLQRSIKLSGTQAEGDNVLVCPKGDLKGSMYPMLCKATIQHIFNGTKAYLTEQGLLLSKQAQVSSPI